MASKKKKIDINSIFEDNRKPIMCDGKRKYKSYNDAKYIADIECQSRRAKNLHIYECPFCHSWHLSHTK